MHAKSSLSEKQHTMKTAYVKPGIKIRHLEAAGNLLDGSDNSFIKTDAGYRGHVGNTDSPQIEGGSALSRQEPFLDK